MTKIVYFYLLVSDQKFNQKQKIDTTRKVEINLTHGSNTHILESRTRISTYSVFINGNVTESSSLIARLSITSN